MLVIRGEEMSKKSKMTLYHYYRSSCSYRIRIALNYKNIPYDLKPINLLKGDQKTSSYTALNSSGLVPTLIDERNLKEVHLTQSFAILEYLDERYPDSGHGRIFPTSLGDRALSRAMGQIIASDTQPVQNFGVLKYLMEELKISEESKSKFAKDFIERGLRSFESMMEKYSGSYAYGGAFSIADICLVPQVYNARRFNVNMDKLPLISRLVDKLLKMDFIEKAAPHYYE